MKIDTKLLMHWRTRMAIELITLLVFMACMKWYDAPSWSFVLLIYIGTRNARIDACADLGALQSTVRVYNVTTGATDETPD